MIIQFNTDNNIEANERLSGYLNTVLSEGLSRFSSHITRLEVHLTDENGNKEGKNDKRCLLEARLEGLQPIAVTNHDNTIEQSVNGALEKLKAALDSAIGRLKKH